MELIEQGGWVLVAIFILSFFAWFLIINKYLYLRNEPNFDRLESYSAEIHNGKLEEIKTIYKDSGLNIGMIAIDIFESRGRLTRKHAREIVEHETIRLRRYLNLIAAAGAVLPLLGLLGTVLGMMKTFDALTLQSFVETNALMSKGISEALITTQAGLVTALPIVLMYGFLSVRVRYNMDNGALALKRLESAISRRAEDV